jgi:hypothetical protein
MPITAKPLFRPEALRPKLAGFVVPAAALAARAKVVQWEEFLRSKDTAQSKETELLAWFLEDVFVEVGSHARLPAGGHRLRAAEYATLYREHGQDAAADVRDGPGAPEDRPVGAEGHPEAK